MKRLFFTLIVLVFANDVVNAQTFNPNVSKDSLGVLLARREVLKASLKVQELKIKESEEESDVEKLRLKLVAANAKAKESAAQNGDGAKKASAGTLDTKSMEKLAKRAKDDTSDAQRALELFHKQIKKVETIRSDIRIEEGKLAGKKPFVVYDYK